MRTKILLLSAMFCCVVFATNAQIEQGRYLAGGSLYVTNGKTLQPTIAFKSQSLNVNLQAGKVIRKNTIVGLLLSYSYAKYTFTGGPDSNKNHSYGAGIFYRKYKRLINNLYLFGETDVAYSHSETVQQYFSTGVQGYRTDMDGVSASFIPGIAYTLCKRMQIELLMPDLIKISYSHSKISYKSDNITNPVADQKANNFYFNSNLNSNLLSSFGIGFKFFVGK